MYDDSSASDEEMVEKADNLQHKERQLRGEYTMEEQVIVDMMRRNQNTVDLVAFSQTKGEYPPNGMRVMNPHLYKTCLATATLLAPEQVKYPYFWKNLKLTTYLGAEEFLRKTPNRDLMCYWHSYHQPIQANVPAMKDSVHQYTPINPNEMQDIINLFMFNVRK
jgi:hypothetical protein